MSVEVKNTICFHFPNGSAKPTMGEIVNFVKALDADADQMEATYRIAEEKALFIKFKCEESMVHALTCNSEDLTFHYANGKAAEVRMSLAGDFIQYVRVYDLPPEVADRDLAMVLGVIREKFPVELRFDMYTGARGVYMDVKKEIPPLLHFLHRKGNIFYDGNKNMCFICKMEGHLMNSCPKRRARKQDEQKQQNDEQSGSGTYAGVVASGSSLDISKDKETEDQVEILNEEVIVMDVMTPTGEESSGEGGRVAQTEPPPVFKNRNDRYYFYKFGIVDYTEKERIKDEEEAKRMALLKQKRMEELRESRAQEKEAKIKSPPRKNKKNS